MSQLPKHKMTALIMLTLVAGVYLLMSSALLHQLGDVGPSTGWIGYTLMIPQDFISNHTFVEILLAILIGFTALQLLRHILKQAVAAYKWKALIKSNRNLNLTKKYSTKYRAWDLQIIVINESTPIAFAAGGLKPFIVISTSLILLMTKGELQSILLHEKYHCQQKHPLIKGVLTGLAESLKFVPVLIDLMKYYNVWMELLADRYAFTELRSTQKISSAMLKLIHSNKTNRCNIGLGFSNTAINYRLRQLVEPEKPISIPMVSLRSVICSSIIVVMIAGVITWGFLHP